MAHSAVDFGRAIPGRTVVRVAGWVGLALAVVVLVASGEAREIARALGAARPLPLVMLVPVGLLLPAVHAARWRLLLRAVDSRLSFGAALDLTVTSSLLNYAAPGGYVWGPAKGLLARGGHGVSLARSTPTLVAEQGLDLLALVVGASLGLLFSSGDIAANVARALETPSPWLIAIVGAVVAIVAVVAVQLGRRYAHGFVSSVWAGTLSLIHDRRARYPVLALTAVRWCLDVAAVWLAARAVGVSLDFGGAVLLSNLPLLVGLLSPMPGGLGFREGAMVVVGAALGVGSGTILAAAVLHRALLVATLPVDMVAVRLAGRLGYGAA